MTSIDWPIVINTIYSAVIGGIITILISFLSRSLSKKDENEKRRLEQERVIKEKNEQQRKEQLETIHQKLMEGLENPAQEILKLEEMQRVLNSGYSYSVDNRRSREKTIRTISGGIFIWFVISTALYLSFSALREPVFAVSMNRTQVVQTAQVAQLAETASAQLAQYRQTADAAPAIAALLTQTVVAGSELVQMRTPMAATAQAQRMQTAMAATEQVSVLPAESTPTPTTKISFDSVPPLGSFENVTGKVSGVDPKKYRVALYIRVGEGWWTKPTLTHPTCPIASDGTWYCQYATGEKDLAANIIRAYLIPFEYTPPSARGNSYLPLDLMEHAVAMVETTR